MNKLLYIITALILFLTCQPYFVWHTGKLLLFLQIILCLLFITHSRYDATWKIILSVLFLSCLILHASVIGSNILGYITWISLLGLLFSEQTFAKNTYKEFTTIYCVVLAVSFIIWILVQIGVSLPYKIMAPLNSLKQTNYMVYPFLATVSESDVFAGVFDERGVVGTLNLILLFIEDFKLKNSKKNTLLLITGIFTFSLAFYLGVLIFYLFNIFVNRSIKIHTKILIVLSLLAVWFLINNISFLYDSIGLRFEFDADKGTLAGDNRAQEHVLEYFLLSVASGSLWLGNDSSAIAMFEGESSIFIGIFQYGLLFFILYFVFWIIYSAKTNGISRRFIMFLLLFAMVMYQRPEFLYPINIVLFSWYNMMVNSNNEQVTIQ